MNDSILHPPVADLLAIAEGQAVPRKAELLDHAATCDGCAALLVALAPDPTPRPVISVHSAPRRRTSVSVWLGAAASIAVVSVGVLSTRPVSATVAVGTLQFTPAKPIPGDTVRVVFRGGLLGTLPRLRLRAELREDDQDYPEWALPKRVVTGLDRRADGSYVGTFVFPKSARYAVFAVEDSTGDVVDANGGRLWDLLAFDSTRTRPTVEALQQKAHLFYERDRAVSREAARTLAKEYPSVPDARRLALWYEQEVAGPAGADSVRALEMPSYRALDARLRGTATMSTALMSGMLSYAEAMRDSLAIAYWSQRLQAEHQNAPLLSMNRMFSALQTSKTPAERLMRLQAMWDDSEIGRPSVALQGFIVAGQLRDPVALRTWGERLRRFGPSGYFDSPVGMSYADYPILAGEGATIMRTQLARFGSVSDTTRSIGRTRMQAQAQTGQTAASRLLALGTALRSLGETQAAAETLTVATRLVWRGDLYAKLSDVRLAAGDTTGAARAAAFALSDPSLPKPRRLALQNQFAAYERTSDWSAWQRAAADTMKAKLWANGVRRTLPGRVRLVDVTGTERTLDALVSKKPTVFAFWSRWCGGSLTELPELQRVSGELAKLGVRLVAVTDYPLDAELQAWLKSKGYTFPVYQDRRGEAGAAFQPYGTPDHILVDGEGVVRFERLRASELPAYGALLVK